MVSKRRSRAQFEWSIESTKLLIGMYEEHEVLYNNTLPEYKDRNKRLEILVKISDFISESTGKFCLVPDVRKKINNLRSQYFAEKSKINKTKSGSSRDIYKPNAYWFPLLKFLDSTTTEDNLSKSYSDEDDEKPLKLQQSPHEISCSNPPLQKKRKKTHQDSTEFIEKVTDTVQTFSHLSSKQSNSNIDVFCQFISSELNSILQTSNISYVNRAKREIQKILFKILDEIDENARNSPFTTNYFFEDSSSLPKNDQQSNSPANYSLENSSPEPMNEPQSICLSNFSLEDSSPVPRNDSPSSFVSKNSLKDYSPETHYTPVTSPRINKSVKAIPISVTQKKIGKPKVIVLKKNLFNKSKPKKPKQ